MTGGDGEIGWSRLAGLTPARIALGRSGAGLPTQEVLKFAMAHAQARDAVHAPFDAARLASEIESLGFPVQHVSSAAPARDVYLRRPDLGRRLDDTSARVLEALPTKGADLAIVIGDGLSSMAVGSNAAAFVDAMVPHIQRLGLHLAPVVIASGARVALGDEVGERLGARMVLVLIGERPGLSSPDSLGAYLTFGPRVGRTDAERNCISNIRSGGLAFDVAAFKLAWLIEAAFARGLTGVSLKDESSTALGWDSKTTIAAP
ncbi:ethanolamine ammonia-lyase subunit EutC [Devosia sp.]|uniref:ethanolamine ammonia-lyase subunit EutC n=1 Tax=Devosia sp. TaxID=1871048 RepID=UPI002FC7DAB4